jgi:BirA family biotin operon repressor/biotin-[acetyl-CoA-carboxylase] ligase
MNPPPDSRPAVEWLDAAAIGAALAPELRAQLTSLEIVQTIDSTNSELLRRTPPPHGVAALLAECQTGGRGRQGRIWASPPAAHLYLSLDRRFSGGLMRLGGLSLVVGIAVAEALRAAGFSGVLLKWPNDLVVVDTTSGLRKLGGVLVEGGGEQAGPVRAVLGIGVNVQMPATDAAKISQPWVDLQTLAAQPVSRNHMATLLLAHLLPALTQFDGAGLAPFTQRYARLDVLAGREIDMYSHSGVQRGTACGIADDGALRVRINGAEQRLYAGEVSIRAA